VGFALGTTYENESGGWKYGYVLWIGVSAKWQRSGAGSQLYHEIERRMHHEGVRMMFIDTAKSNTGAIKFFNRMGYGKPEAEVWMSKLIQRTPRSYSAGKPARPLVRHRRAGVQRKIAAEAKKERRAT
jgi:ribosomal protein S18 acetylase RimI-like enzyme